MSEFTGFWAYLYRPELANIPVEYRWGHGECPECHWHRGCHDLNCSRKPIIKGIATVVWEAFECIKGVISWPLKKYEDERGWLCELFRTDEGFRPEMGYVSMTLPGVSRGPHEHVHQTDLFFFMGKFKVYLWHKGARETRILDHMALIVPPGVVHAYKNIGEAALVYNFPDKLYKGPGRKDPVDEIRHEDDPSTIYVLD